MQRIHLENEEIHVSGSKSLSLSLILLHGPRSDPRRGGVVHKGPRLFPVHSVLLFIHYFSWPSLPSSILPSLNCPSCLVFVRMRQTCGLTYCSCMVHSIDQVWLQLGHEPPITIIRLRHTCDLSFVPNPSISYLLK